jgi:polar amino acid transport system permease protein
LLRTSNATISATFRAVYLRGGLVAVIFFVLCCPLTQYARALEKRAFA